MALPLMLDRNRRHPLRDWSFDQLERLVTLLLIGLVLLVVGWWLLGQS